MKNKIQSLYDVMMKEIKVPNLEEWMLEFGEPREPITPINMLDEIREPIEPRALRIVEDLMMQVERDQIDHDRWLAEQDYFNA